jgi:FkbM family methyltransferase
MKGVIAEDDLVCLISQLNRTKGLSTFDDVELFRPMRAQAAIRAGQLLASSSGQLRQDVFAAAALGFKRDGYFVEFGATDGVYLSNSLLLERDFGWTGVLAEPARHWHAALAAARTARIDKRCVHVETGKTLAFREVDLDPGLSTLSDYQESDSHGLARRSGADYPVETVSLIDLLREHGAPSVIDYLSIDTEGSELDILEAFDFSAYTFRVITCEHNHTANRNAILRLLRRNGYRRVLNAISLFDDWYVHKSAMKQFAAAFPGWKAVSHERAMKGPPPRSEAEQTIALLRETVVNLIAERDGYVAAVKTLTDRQAGLDALTQSVELLQQNIANVILERDAYRTAADALVARLNSQESGASES